jgi:hypothetical protein
LFLLVLCSQLQRSPPARQSLLLAALLLGFLILFTEVGFYEACNNKVR